MKKTAERIFAVFMSLLLLLPAFGIGVITASAGEEPELYPMIDFDPETEFVPGELMIMLREAHPEADLAELLPEIEITGYEDVYASVIEVVGEKNVDEKLLDEVGMTFVITLADETEEGVINALDKLSENIYILSASPDYLSEPCSTTPNDTYYGNQWALPKISAPETWDIITDSTVRIAVLDTGTNGVNSDISNNINTDLSYNAFTQTLGEVEDGGFHGTHVSGIIAAEGNNNKGVCGVAWNAEIVPIRIAGPNGAQASNAAEVRGLIYAEAIGAKVANISFDLVFSYPLWHALISFSNSGGLIVLAAGNGDTNHTPINLDNSYEDVLYSAVSGVIYVGSSDQYDNPASDSNYGLSTVDIFAPGVSIYSTFPADSYNGPICEYLSGTSMAAPFVTGTIALLMSKYPDLPASTIKDAIIDNADFVYALATKCVAHGRLNIKAALDALDGITAPSPYYPYNISVSTSVVNGTIIPSRTSASANMFITLNIDPDPGYWLKPDTLAYNGVVIDQTFFDGYVYDPINQIYVYNEYGEYLETDGDGYLYENCWYFQMPSSDVTITAVFYMIGDVDENGFVDITDALAVLQHANGLTPQLTGIGLIAADVDGDGDVDNDDAQYILDYYAGNITVFPIEA